MNEFVLVDAAVWRGLSQFDDPICTTSAVSLYADLPSRDARLFGPWLFEAAAFDAIVPNDAPPALPWRYGISRLTTKVSLADLAAHFESQRSLAMAAGDRYYLRYADTRALATLERVLTPSQMAQLKGPVVHWRYLDRFDEEQEFGQAVAADPRRHEMIVLSEEQAWLLLEQQLAQVLADDVSRGSDGNLRPHLVAEQYRYVEASAAFVLEHGIEPFDVQRHIAAVAVQTGGTLLTNGEFLDDVKSLRASGRWHELMKWRAVSRS
jgi:hypothetical protein